MQNTIKKDTIKVWAVCLSSILSPQRSRSRQFIPRDGYVRDFVVDALHNTSYSTEVL